VLFSKTSTSCGKATQRCAERIQPWRSIVSQLGSSKLPPAMARVPQLAAEDLDVLLPEIRADPEGAAGAALAEGAVATPTRTGLLFVR
jgi:hypothetical protein